MRRRTIENSLETFDFTAQPVFIGKYVDTITITPESGEKKAFDQHIFINSEDGEEIYIPDNYVITKALANLSNMPDFDKEKDVLEIEFKGKSEINGKPFSRFKVSILYDEDEAETMYEVPKNVEIPKRKEVTKKVETPKRKENKAKKA